MYKLGNVITSYPKDMSLPWVFQTANKKPIGNIAAAEITFYPETKHTFSTNFWLIKSHFDQAFGVFKGTIKTNDKDIGFQARGLIEVHHTRW